VQIKKILPTLQTLWLTLITLGFFWTISSRILSLNFQLGISQRWIGIGLIITYFVSCAVFTFFDKDKNSRFANFVKLLSVGFFSMLYATIIDWQVLFEYEVPGRKITIHTGYIYIPLTILNIWTYFNTFQSKKKSSILLFLQTFLVILCTFGFVDLLTKDRTSIRIFNIDYLSLFTSLNPIIWIILSLGLVAFLTTAHSLNNYLDKFKHFSLTFFVLLQSLFVVGIKPFNLIEAPTFTYLHKAVLFIIFWNFVHKSISEATSDDDRGTFISRTIGNSIYHALLATITITVFLL
jgi:hypothetical protein